MKFGVHIVHEDLNYQDIEKIVMESEKLGYDSIWLGDHFFFTSPKKALLECWTLLSALASKTKTIRLGTLVLCNSFRHPSLVAKMAATLDVISGGRLEFGIGAGWHKKEHLAYGFPFLEADERIRKLDEALELIKGMWTLERFTFKGKFYSVRDAVCNPKPIQKPHPPIWIGGTGKMLLKVVAKHADGCNFERFDMSPQRCKEKLEILKRYCAKYNRDYHTIQKSISITIAVGRSEKEVKELSDLIKKDRLPLYHYLFSDYLKKAFQRPREALSFLTSRALGLEVPPSIIIGTPDECIAKIKEYIDSGVTYFIFKMPKRRYIEGLRLFAEEVLPYFKNNM
jgi:F420-dependent oxidoreductase-like protein